MSDGALAALVGNRVEPIFVTQPDMRPYVTYIKNLESPINSAQGTGAGSISQFTVDVFAEKYTTVKAVESAIRAAMLTFVNLTPSGQNVYVQGNLLTAASDETESPFDASGKPLFHVALNYDVHHQAA